MSTHASVWASDSLAALVTVLDLVRTGEATTRPEIVRRSGLGRNVVTHRVSQLIESGLLSEGSLAQSTGGRAPRQLRLRSDAGHVLVAELGATRINVALSDLSGRLTGQYMEPADVTEGPEAVLGRVAELFDELRVAHPGDVWGVGIGLPGPVEFSTGRPVAPPIMPGWDGYDVRGYLSDRYAVPTWVDNDVNVMVLGELRDGRAQGYDDVIYVKVGSGIGAGLVSGGRLHRGAQGCAGDIGHIAAVDDPKVVCRCGQIGCLEAIAGGAAIARDGEAAAISGRSSFLARMQADGEPITAAAVSRAALYGDAFAVSLVTQSAQYVGESLARIVNFFNPAQILVGGTVPEVGDLYLATVRQIVFGRSLPLATRNLILERSLLGDTAGLKGAAFMVIDELLSPACLANWIERKRPGDLSGATA